MQAHSPRSLCGIWGVHAHKGAGFSFKVPVLLGFTQVPATSPSVEKFRNPGALQGLNQQNFGVCHPCETFLGQMSW